MSQRNSSPKSQNVVFMFSNTMMMESLVKFCRPQKNSRHSQQNSIAVLLYTTEVDEDL